MNPEGYFLIAGVVAFADYLQNPECFEDLILLCANHSTSPTLAPNVDASMAAINAIAGNRDSLDRDLSALQGQLPPD